MIPTKTVSIYSILERLYRTSGFTKNFNVADAIELAGEAIDLIGAPTALESKITDGNAEFNHPAPIEIKNYKGLLPKDLHMITQTRTFDEKIPMKYSTDTFHGALYCEDNCPDLSVVSTLTYKIKKGGVINTSFKEGKVEMAYKAYFIDEHGLPLIPHEERYVKGVEAYIKEAMYRPLWELGKISDKVYSKAEQERDWYIGSAENYAKLDGIDGMTNIKNMMLNLIPDIHHTETFFRNVGDEQKVINHNNFGSWSR